MKPQAVRRTTEELLAAQRARRIRRQESQPEPFDWADAAGFATIGLVWLIFVACVIGWWLGADSLAIWALAPIAWGKPDRLMGRAVCESIERTMPHTPWRWERRHGFSHGAACALSWLVVGFLLFSVAALAAAK